MEALSQFLSKFFAERVFGHLPSTVGGGIAAVALALATYTHELALPNPWNYVAYAVSFLLFAFGSAYKKPEPAPTP